LIRTLSTIDCARAHPQSGHSYAMERLMIRSTQWYLWCLKPAMGAMVGLVFALAIELGLISLGAGEPAKVDLNLRLLVLGGMAAFFSEGVFERVRSKVEGRVPR
jgi:hypothetical protein